MARTMVRIVEKVGSWIFHSLGASEQSQTGSLLQCLPGLQGTAENLARGRLPVVGWPFSYRQSGGVCWLDRNGGLRRGEVGRGDVVCDCEEAVEDDEAIRGGEQPGGGHGGSKVKRQVGWSKGFKGQEYYSLTRLHLAENTIYDLCLDLELDLNLDYLDL